MRVNIIIFCTFAHIYLKKKKKKINAHQDETISHHVTALPRSAGHHI